MTTLTRSYIGFSGLDGQTYMIGGYQGVGGNALWFTSGEYPSANPMQVNKNGKTIRKNNQSKTYYPF